MELLHTCAWPSLSEVASHPIIAHGRRTSAEGDGDELGRVCACLRTCAVRQGHALSHAYLLENVLISTREADIGREVSGDLTRRGLNVSVRRTHTTTRERRSTRHHAATDVKALPLRVAHLPSLRLLWRLVWRLEHLTILVEMSEAPTGLLARQQWLPSGCEQLPLPLLASALTSKGASVEAIDLVTSSSQVAADVDCPSYDDMRHDKRGCCHYEVAEWAGDAFRGA
eukprot:6841786-Prymnesium_polylepis.1